MIFVTYYACKQMARSMRRLFTQVPRETVWKIAGGFSIAHL
jgi:hypothetical protein